MVLHKLLENTQAPDFDMPISEFESITLKNLAGKNIVLYFYPKDDTPGCTNEAKDFRDFIEEFDKLNTVIIGVSKDSITSHKKFKEKHCLPFILASDIDGKVCNSYGVWVEKSMYGRKYMGIERSTFLIDKTGLLRKIWYKVSVKGHVKEILNTIKTIN